MTGALHRDALTIIHEPFKTRHQMHDGFVKQDANQPHHCVAELYNILNID